MQTLRDVKPGEKVRMPVEREPRPLYRILERNGYACFASVQPGYLGIDICAATSDDTRD